MGRELRHDPVPGIVIVILVVVGSLAAPWLALRFLEDRGGVPSAPRRLSWLRSRRLSRRACRQPPLEVRPCHL